MTTHPDIAAPAGQARQTNLPGYPPSTLAFDGLIALLALWIAAGLYLDGWYHNTFQDSVETFMTPWHAVLYSGVLAAGTVLLVAYVRNFRRGYHWRRALPPSYLAALIGFELFALSGLVDMAWHNVFGFEFDVEALLSPPHLALAASMLPLVSAPFRMAWDRPRAAQREGWRTLLPALVSLLLMLSIFTFFTQFANAYTHPNVYSSASPGTNGFYREVTGIASSLIPAGLSIAFVLLALRRWALPPGSLALLLTANAAAMYALSMAYSGEHWPVLLAALGGGLAAEALYHTLRPSPLRVTALRVFALAVPFVMTGLFFVTLLLTDRLVWRVHLWLGTAVLAGVVGLGLSYLLVPPALPADEPSLNPS